MQKNHCDILCHSVGKKYSILPRKPSHKVKVPLKTKQPFYEDISNWLNIKKSKNVRKQD